MVEREEAKRKLKVLDTIKKSEVDIFFLTVHTKDGFSETAKSIARISQFLDDHSELKVVKEYSDIERNKSKGYKSLLLAFEDPYPIGFSMNRLRVFYELGIRVMQLTYNQANYIGTGCAEGYDAGLTQFGKSIIKEMNKLGILIDLSHCSKLTSKEAIEISEKPVVFSHANVNRLCHNIRNKDDDLIRLIASKGGMVGITPWSPLCWDGRKGTHPSLDNYLNHVEYVIDLVGIDHVGIDHNGLGSAVTSAIGQFNNVGAPQEQIVKYPSIAKDYYTEVGTDRELAHVKGFDGPQDIHQVIAGLQGRGYDEEAISKFLSGNMIRVLRRVMER